MHWISQNLGPLLKAETKLSTKEAYNFATKVAIWDNATDNQALIYAFAKAMDPDSVVREWEYATVQKYAQTWWDKLWMNINRILNWEEFISPEAKKNMVNTINEHNHQKTIYERKLMDLSKMLTRNTLKNHSMHLFEKILTPQARQSFSQTGQAISNVFAPVTPTWVWQATQQFTQWFTQPIQQSAQTIWTAINKWRTEKKDKKK